MTPTRVQIVKHGGGRRFRVPLCPAIAAVFVTASLGLAACGRSTPAPPVATRVCGGAASAARKVLIRPVKELVASRDPSSLTCDLSASGVTIALVLQVSSDAFTAFNTMSAHQSQVYGPGVHQSGETPQPTTVNGAVVAVWIPGFREIMATDANPGHGGVFLTATASGSGLDPRLALRLDQRVAEAAFAVHPDAGS